MTHRSLQSSGWRPGRYSRDTSAQSIAAASSVDSLKAEREGALPVAALALGDDSIISPAALAKAAQLLPQQIAQLQQELASRQQLVLLLASACEKQQALFEKLRGSIDDCTALHVAAQSMSAAADAGGYSPTD